MHHTYEDIAPHIEQKLGNLDVVTHEITLGEFDSSWHPASTSRRIYGPANVKYIRFPDGGVDVDFEQLDDPDPHGDGLSEHDLHPEPRAE